MIFSVREASGKDDVAFITRLFELPHARAMLNPPGRNMVEAALDDPNNEGYVIEAGRTPAGHLLLKNYGWLVELGILIAREPRRGLGRFALEWALRHAFESCGAHRVYAEVRADNGAIGTLLQRLGLREEGRFHDGFRDAVSGRYADLIPCAMLRTQYVRRRPEALPGNPDRRRAGVRMA